MNMNTAEFFYSHYVGYMPENPQYVICTEGMINHYIEAKLDWAITKIFETCAKDAVLSPKNIPYNIWNKDNLIKPNIFYLHPILKITNPPPIYDPFTDKTIVSDYYCEIKEFFSVNDIYKYIIETLKSPFLQLDRKKSIGAIYHCLNRYKEIGKKFNLEALDILLTAADCASGYCKQIIEITNYEENAIHILTEYQKRLESLSKNKIEWRPACKCLSN